jgi:hypothetical protein
MYTVWERDMLYDGRSWVIAMPNANFAGPRSEISHFDWKRALKDSSSCFEDVAAKISSMWTEKMTVPKGDEW